MNVINQHTKIIFGDGSVEYLKDIHHSNILVVTDRFLTESGMIDSILAQLSQTNQITIFDRVKPDPSLNVVSSGLAIAVKKQIDVLIGFGGGSAIDTAKAVLYFMQLSNDLDKKVLFIAIPTTSGTGSEATSAAVITEEEENIKHVFFSDCMMPDIAILDVSFTKSLPQSVIANTGMDVLTHAIEAYVSKGANDYSDALAEKSGELIFSYLYRSFCGEDDLAREKMHIASNLAGMAFNIAGLGLNHSIAHQIGAIYHVPHGLANALLLNKVIEFNSVNVSIKQKYAQYAKKLGMIGEEAGVEESIRKLKRFIDGLVSMMDMPKKLSNCAVNLEYWETDKEMLAENTLKDTCLAGNPVCVSKKEVLDILDKIY